MHPLKYVWALRALIYKPFFNTIGNMSYIGKPCFLAGTKLISIGEKDRIFPGIRMEAIEGGRIIIGNNVAIEQNVHIISHSTFLKIGNDTTISANVFISNVNHKYDDIRKSVMDQGIQKQETIIGDSCFIGYGAVILPGTVLGNHCIIGANAVVKGKYPSNSVVVGAPGRVVKQYNDKQKEWRKTSV
mgnify:FL=1